MIAWLGDLVQSLFDAFMAFALGSLVSVVDWAIEFIPAWALPIQDFVTALGAIELFLGPASLLIAPRDVLVILSTVGIVEGLRFSVGLVNFIIRKIPTIN